MSDLERLLRQKNKTLMMWKSPHREYWVASAIDELGDACEQGDGISPDEAQSNLATLLR